MKFVVLLTVLLLLFNILLACALNCRSLTWYNYFAKSCLRSWYCFVVVVVGNDDVFLSCK